MGREFGTLFGSLTGAAIIVTGLLLAAVIITPLFLIAIAAYVEQIRILGSAYIAQRHIQHSVLRLYGSKPLSLRR